MPTRRTSVVGCCSGIARRTCDAIGWGDGDALQVRRTVCFGGATGMHCKIGVRHCTRRGATLPGGGGLHGMLERGVAARRRSRDRDRMLHGMTRSRDRDRILHGDWDAFQDRSVTLPTPILECRETGIASCTVRLGATA